MLDVKYKFLNPHSIVDTTTGEESFVDAQPNYKLSVNGVISINPQFKKSRRLVEYQKAKELLEDCRLDLHYFPHAVTDENKKQYKRLEYRTREAHRRYENLKESFIYDRKNKTSIGASLSSKSAKKIKLALYWLYQKQRDSGSRYLWYTFTLPSRLSGLPYNPVKHDAIVSAQFSKLLENIRKHWGVSEYITVAERQDGKRIKNRVKNPTNALHYHVVFVQDENSYLDVQRLNLYWLSLLGEVGFEVINLSAVEKKKQSIIAHIKTLHNSFEKGTCSEQYYRQRIEELYKDLRFYNLRSMKDNAYNWERLKHLIPRDKRNLRKDNLIFGCVHNPVDCTEIKSFKKLGTYLAKYISKSDHKIYCRVWSQTRFFSGLKTSISIPSSLPAWALMKKHKVKTVSVKKEIHGIEYHWYRVVYKSDIWNLPLLKAYLNYILYDSNNKKTIKNSKAYYQNKLWDG